MGRRPPPGLQAERTVLAWHRTTLAQAAVAVLLLRLDAVNGWRGRGLPAALAVLAALASWAGGRARAGAPGPGGRVRRWPLAWVALGTTATALAAVALAWPPG